MAKYRYGRYVYGPDPLELPFDVRGAVDEMGDSILAGANPADALRDLLRRGLGDRGGRRGLDDLLRRARDRQREIRGSGRLDGILEQARALLDTAVGQERAELFPDPSDEARLREANLDALPADTAQAIRQLADYDWRSAAARQTFDQLKELLRSEVLDSQFRGMRQVMSNPDPQAMQRVKDMLGDLNEMLAADARGEHAQADFDRFMERHGDLFPDQPQNLEELVDSLVRRMAAAERLLRSLSDEQREELAGLMASALDDAGLAAEMAGLETALGQDYPGASLDDIDEDAVRRAFGRQAVDDVEALRRIERELERQGYLTRNAGQLELTPKAVRRLGDTALRRIFSDLSFGRSGDHDLRDAGQAGELTGTTRAWEFGDEQPLDVPATVRNALLRTAGSGAQAPAGAKGVWGDGQSPRDRGGSRGGRPPRTALASQDFEVAETERRSAAVVSLLVDLSYSMQLRGTWAAAKQTALALHALLRSRFPQDAVQVVGFSNYARELHETELAGLGWDMVQGTNLHHALMIAGRHLDKHPEHDPVVLIVTDGEPTAHLMRDGRPWFDWPPAPETIELTLAEVDKMTRRHAVLNIFMLAEDERLTAFVEEVARRNGGRLFRPEPQRLGEYVVADFLRTRRGRAGRR